MTTDVDPSLNGHATDAPRRMLDALGNEFSPASVDVLESGGISVADAVRYGVRAVAHPDHVPDEIARYWVQGDGRGPGMLFEWRDQDRTVVQFRPDRPVKDDKGELHKYVLPKGCGTFLNHLRAPSDDGQPYLLVEGTKQGITAAVWAPQSWGVVAVPGCDSWVGTDLMWADGRRVVVLFDGDVSTNRNVHDAAVKLKEALEAEGAAEAVFAKIPGARGTDGLDDVLGRRPADRRTDFLERIAGQAVAKLGRPPARKAASVYMTDKGLLAESASLAVLGNQPAALAAGSTVALYRDGAFRLDMGDEPLIGEVRKLLGEDYRPNWRATIKEFLVGELYSRGMRLPEKLDAPLLNCANGMLDLATGRLLDHDPKYLSSRQIPVAWDPDARAPRYETWLYDLLPDQLDDLEEVSSTMLDPSRTPQKVLFAFGPSHSGKSTYLRLLRAVAGGGNTSAVTMHQLSEDKFAAANIYGQMLNVAADLAAEHVRDTSLFKTLTGEDLVHANRKYGGQFSFTSTALFAFSANEIPTVSETTDAYANRMKPFKWGRSFAGKEDPTLEDGMREELPGILVRWVAAWQRYTERGAYLPTLPDVKEEFDTRSDRVARWVATRCDIHRDAIGRTVGADQGDTVTSLYVAFKAWASDDGPAHAMSRPKFSERLRTLPGVGDVRLSHKNKNAGLNVTTHTGEDRELVVVRSNRKETDTESVGSVGKNRTLAVAGSESKSGEGANQPATGKGSPQPTLPTLPTPMIKTPPADREAVEFLGRYATECDDERVRDRDEDRDGIPLDARLHGDRAVPQRDATGSGPAAQGTGTGAAPVPELCGSPAAAVVRPLAGQPNPFAVPDPLPPRADPSAPLVLDLETGDANRWLSAPVGEYVTLVCLGDGDVPAAATADLSALDLVRSSTGPLVTVNGALFDLPVLDRHHGIPVEDTIPRVQDLRLVAFQADPPTSRETKPGPGFKSYSMDALLNRYLGGAKSADGKALAKEYGGWDNVPTDDPRFLEYGRSDIRNTAALVPFLPMTDYDRREARVAAVTARATLEGFRVDRRALSERVAADSERSRAGRQLLAERYGFPLTNKAGKAASAPQRTKEGKQAFAAALASADFAGLDRWPVGKDGSLSMGKDVMAYALTHAQDEGNELAALVIRAVQEMNGVRTNAANILRCVVDGRVHPRFEPFQTTGRWSVTEPGLTVCTKGATDSERQYLLPDEGDLIVCFDADQVDIRGVAAHSQDPALLEIMCDPDRDIHNEVSDDAFGDHEEKHRKAAKTMDLGWFYGRSKNGLAQTPGMTYEGAEAVDASMRGRFTRVLQWQSEIRTDAERGNLLDNGFGRNLRCEPGREYTQAPAMVCQSATRDLVAAGLLVMREKYPHLIPRLRVVVHDEVVFSLRADRLEESCAEVIDAMTGVFNGVPITWGTSRPGENWNECYMR